MADEIDKTIAPSDAEWEYLTSAILKQKCILVLGPKAAVDPRNPSKPVLPVQLAQHLAELLKRSNALPQTKEDAAIDLSRIPIENLTLIAQYYKREFKARQYSPRRYVEQLDPLP